MLVAFIIGRNDSILPVSDSSCVVSVSDCVENYVGRFLYGDSSVMAAWKPVELQDWVQFQAIALSEANGADGSQTGGLSLRYNYILVISDSLCG